MKIDSSPNLNALAGLASELAVAMASVASDIALVVDEDGVIVSVVQGRDQALAKTPDDWVGRRWAETVTKESRNKIDELVREVTACGTSSRAREVNHRSELGETVAMAYTAVRLGDNGPILALGRDLRAITELQQRLISSQQTMERDYWRRRRSDARYQLFFQLINEAVLLLDAGTGIVIDANRAAGRIFGAPTEALKDRPASSVFHPRSAGAVEELVASACLTGPSQEIEAYLDNGRGRVRVCVTPFQSDGVILVMKVSMPEEVAVASPPDVATSLTALMKRTPDAIVITDCDGTICLANPAFQQLIAASEQTGETIAGTQLGAWLGSRSNELPFIIGMARKEGAASLLATEIRRSGGPNTEVELSAAYIPAGDTGIIGFIIREAGRSAGGTPGSDPESDPAQS